MAQGGREQWASLLFHLITEHAPHGATILELIEKVEKLACDQAFDVGQAAPLLTDIVHDVRQGIADLVDAGALCSCAKAGPLHLPCMPA